MQPSAPLDPSIRNVAEIEIMLTEASEQQAAVEVDEGIAASNPHIAFEDPIGKLSSRVTTVQPLILRSL